MSLTAIQVVQPPKEHEYIASFFSGCLAGVCSTCITNPLDTVRVRLSVSRSITGKSHKSLMYTVRDLFQTGLTHGFSRGLVANLAASLPSNGIYLPTYHCILDNLAVSGLNTNIRPAVAACGAVCVTNMVLAPLFLVRTRVQVDDTLTMRQAFRKVMQTDGFLGLYRGTMTNILGRFVEEGLFWSIYELLKRARDEAKFGGPVNFFITSVAVLSLTVVAKVAATVVSYPYNVVMNHLRSVNHSTGISEYSKVFPTIRHIYRDDGVVGFYRGLLPHLLRSTLSKSVQIYAYEVAMYSYFRCVQGTVCSPKLWRTPAPEGA